MGSSVDDAEWTLFVRTKASEGCGGLEELATSAAVATTKANDLSLAGCCETANGMRRFRLAILQAVMDGSSEGKKTD